MKKLSKQQIKNLSKKALELKFRVQADEISREKALRTYARFVREELNKQKLFDKNYKFLA